MTVGARLMLAGEACSAESPATVHGAYRSGAPRRDAWLKRPPCGNLAEPLRTSCGPKVRVLAPRFRHLWIRRCFSGGPPSINPVKTIERWNQIPDFEDEKEEAAFWADHTLDPRLMNAAIQRQTVRESTTITLRFDPQMLSRIKRLARQRYLNYQSMIKQWLSERLEEEVLKQSSRGSERGED